MLSFDEKEQKLLNKIAYLYKKTKPLILYSEEIDPNYEANAQIWKELRDALDHLMRVFIRKFEAPSLSEEDRRYINSNLYKVVGHIYRAGCDALEGTCLSLRDEIKKIYDNFDLEALNDVIPSFWRKKVRIQELSEKIADLRGQKDVSDSNMEKIFDSFVEIAEELREMYDQFKSKVFELEEYQKKLDEKNKKDHQRNLVIAVISALVGAIISSLITYIVSH